MTFTNDHPVSTLKGRSPPVRTVGIGASAGGLGACKELFAHLPADTGMAFIVVLHLDPKRVSHLGELLSKSTSMPVVSVSSEQQLLPNHVYVIVPDTALEFRDSTLYPHKREERPGVRKPIDALFEGLARDQRERAIGVVLSGSADDGSAGLREIHQVGGICLAQDPETAEFDGMPSSAVATGVVDKTLRPAEIARELVELVGRERDVVSTPDDAQAGDPLAAEPLDIEEESDAFQEVLSLVDQRRGLNFELYRLGTMGRRITRRMGLKRAPDLESYLDILRQQPAEIDELYQDLLIDVTQFFRDPTVWEYLAGEVIPKLVEGNDEDRPLRFWVTACASGEEAYTLAMVVLDVLDAAERRDAVQIFATDVNPRALEIGRRGLYSSEIADHVSEERLQRYFIGHGEHFQINSRVREMVTFAVHDLLTDPPFSRMNLVTCRNLLIYLEPEAQKRALEVMRYALCPGGYLLLGTSESIGQRNQNFEVLSKTLRVYKATESDHKRGRPLARWLTKPKQDLEPTTSRSPRPGRAPGARLERHLEEYILGKHAPAAVAVDPDLNILHFYGPTDDYLTAPTGAAEFDLLAWIRPGLYAGLQPALSQAIEQNDEVETGEMYLERDGEASRVICRIEPLDSLPGGDGIFLITFRRASNEATEAGKVAADERSLVERLETQLRTARREQRQLVGQLEDSNEEYQAHHEELLSLNEELQSTNEELETSKEELQSLNEEMLTVNRELEEKNEELRELNTDLNNLLVSTEIPTVFLDEELRVRRFTPASTQVMRLVPSDIGRSIEHIKERSGDVDLVATAEQVMDNDVAHQAEIQTDDGRYFLQQIMPYRTDAGAVEGVTVTYTDITEQRNRAAEVQEARQYSEAIVRTIRTPLLVLDADLRVVSTNDAFCQLFRTYDEAMSGKRLFDLDDGRWDIPGLRDLLEKVLPERLEVEDYGIEHVFDTQDKRFLRLNARTMERPDNAALILLSIEDVTARMSAEMEAKQHAEELAEEHKRKDEFLATLGHELRNPLAALSYGLEYIDGADEDARCSDTHAMMGRQLRRMKNMLDQLLETSRLASGKIELEFEPVDLAEVVEHALETVRPLVAKHNHELMTSLRPAGDCVVLGDSDRLAQVIENLVTNAVKYTDDGGQIEVNLDAEGDETTITVRDSGVGIEPELLPHVFELFTQSQQTLQRSEGGLGLGLALARRLVELHQGRLTAHSEGLGSGSEFVITLPRIDRVPRADDAEPEGAAKPQARRVLIVDDEADAADLFALILGIEGHEAKTANDGPGALEIVRSFHPEVIFLDLGLPGMNGYEVAKRIRDEVGDEPIIVALTGYHEDAAKMESSGIDRHEIKPPDLDALAAWLAVLD